ncbi:MAG: hypothetical protein ICV74_07880 [Thermoleophilia bacterium]|nr:hypothetical protein [Thermoleophilia bacterium]
MEGNRALLDEALAVVRAANEAGLPVRLAGSAAVLAHAPRAAASYSALARRVADIDLVTRSKVTTSAIEGLLVPRGYEPLSHHNVWHGETRQMFDREDGLHIDVFRDELNFCHPIEVKDRLEADDPTIPLPELLLAKLQIVEITEKDFQDVALLFLDHELGPGHDEIDGAAVAPVLAHDWGFWYTATSNLEKTRAYLGRSPFADDERRDVAARIAALEARIEEEPKSGRWKLRSRIGTKKRWYQEVEEAHR